MCAGKGAFFYGGGFFVVGQNFESNVYSNSSVQSLALHISLAICSYYFSDWEKTYVYDINLLATTL